MKSDQSGIAHVAAILAVIVIAAIGFAGWKVWHSKENNKSASPVSTSSKSDSQPVTQPTRISVLEEGKLVLPNGHADPTVVPIPNGGYRMYVNRQSGGPTGILIYTSKDGITWEKEKDIIIPGASTSRAVALPNGVRLYYPGPQPINPSSPQADMYSTFSTDGLTFTKDAGTVIKPRSSAYYIEGPTVFQLPDKSWRMYFNENTVAAAMQRDGEIWGASSADGLTWTRDDKVTLQASEEEAAQGNMRAPWKQVLHPFVLKNPKGGYIMFYNSHSELYAATSTDGLAWKKIGRIGIHGADIDGYFQPDGTIRVYYGDFSPSTGGVVYMAVLKVQ
ncbi:MAG TPA: hypothetical protein VJ836_02400 [Candidatus Saccharimonadales bacterium]|nr:hypothetical protein [Candidatus Saccharimonadales bacterium]